MSTILPISSFFLSLAIANVMFSKNYKAKKGKSKWKIIKEL